MDENILISIESKHYQKETGNYKEAFSCKGSLIYKENRVYIRYTEPENGEERPAAVTLKIDGKNISMMRSGDANSHFVFEQGVHHPTRYLLSYGSLLMDIYTKKLATQNNENGGKIHICYTLTVEEKEQVETDFTLTYKLINNN